MGRSNGNTRKISKGRRPQNSKPRHAVQVHEPMSPRNQQHVRALHLLNQQQASIIEDGQ